ncbi:Uma2 family endonuclease [Oscillatoria sp. CS-180]|uniref:Uma2 family endonuclease n=1 Tax=Oscillatoria sp. CS-180 TaxID=3021720 RepID=UPI00232FA25E|nr:Uma2 family endonuclease [Oscillatoria sp. CS-180]MDB9529450.1 Uma2 family endonuclease [Oscillatoria sp. CS-180]
MVSQLRTSDPQPDNHSIVYPDSDGQPMSDNTKQFRWIVLIQQNLEAWFADVADVFVAGDLLWYPVEGEPKIRQAPDAMVVFGRSKGDRGSYKQWLEDDIAPQVVFEVRSPGNTQTELDKKLVFYDRYGVEEYYLYDPDRNDLSGWLREERLTPIDSMTNWVSPRLEIRFDWQDNDLTLYLPNGVAFTTLEQERQRAEAAELRAAQLAERLRAMGIDPDQLQ